jgi:hypothetical protein
MITASKQPTEVQSMPSDLRSIDLATLNIAREVIVASLRSHVCQWEQQSADAVADGRLSNAVMLQNWSFAGELLTGVVSTEISGLFSQSLNARFGDLTTTSHRSVADQILDAVALEVASAQQAPELAPF